MARGRHRKHKPAEIGPRTFRCGRFYQIDMRALGGDRTPIRDPKHPNWPDDGDRTTDAETAQRWAWACLDHRRIDAKQRHLGLRGPSKPVGAEVARFLAHQERTKSAKTGVTQNALLAIHFVPLAKRYAVSTIASYLTVVRTFVRWRSKGAHDPTRGVAMPDPGERDVEPWTDDELAQLRKAANKLDATDHAEGPASQLRSFRVALEELQKFLGHASIKTTEQSYGWLTEQAATTLARARIYGEGLRVVRSETGRRAERAGA